MSLTDGRSASLRSKHFRIKPACHRSRNSRKWTAVKSRLRVTTSSPGSHWGTPGTGPSCRRLSTLLIACTAFHMIRVPMVWGVSATSKVVWT